MEAKISRPELAVMSIVAVAMCAATAFDWWSISWTEVLGFVSGAVCVWLVVREHLWNWPIGLANNAVFLILFWRSRLYADALLQIVYFVLGVYGWWNWLHGGFQQSKLTIKRATRLEWAVLAATIPLGIWALHAILVANQDASPWLDSSTTVLSLAAQILMCRKRIEHWLYWIAADVIYIPLYISRQLPLTAVLYFVFLLMCSAGLQAWRAAIRETSA